MSAKPCRGRLSAWGWNANTLKCLIDSNLAAFPCFVKVRTTSPRRVIGAAVCIVVHRHGCEYGPHAFFGAGGLVPSHDYPASAYPQTPYQQQQVAGQRHARARPAGTNARTPDAARNTTELALCFRSFGSAGGALSLSLSSAPSLARMPVSTPHKPDSLCQVLCSLRHCIQINIRRRVLAKIPYFSHPNEI
ncbi:hypothetical protein B0H13DRAFT_2313331 [Mycena leptocephala]|nr:hypothetical protein B0H13DRAFT_2313331 [Mycena leptocephala]